MAELEAAEKHAIDMLTGRYTSVVDEMESIGDTSFEDAEGAMNDFDSFRITEPSNVLNPDLEATNEAYESCEECFSENDEDEPVTPIKLLESTEVTSRELKTVDEFKLQPCKKFEVDDRLINACEKSMDMLFEPLPLKRTIDQWIAEIDKPELFDWVVQKNTDEIRIWTRAQGLP